MLEEEYIRDGFVFDLYDGDTVYYHIDLGYDVWVCHLTGRLLGINTPEIRPLKTRAAGTASKEALLDMIKKYALGRDEEPHPLGHRVRIQSVKAKSKHIPRGHQLKKGKYGRWLVTLWGVDDAGNPVNINELMIKEGFARRYKL